MSRMFKALAAVSLAAVLIAPEAFAGKRPAPGQGVVLVPASYSLQKGADQGMTIYDYQDEYAGFKRARIVDYPAAAAVGSIIVDTRQHALYLVLGNGKAAKYRVATAKPGFGWSGTHPVASKTQWPDWRPPAEMRKRRPELPAFMAGGPKNPLGARAIYIGGTIYRIHGTNEPDSIGKSASSGCIRMLNEDVSELYRFVKVGASVTVL
jgi:lipoprotein-anchoring transpeptidase ErfK/SrfK